MDGSVVKPDVLSSVFLYIVAYIFILLLSMLLALIFGVEVDMAFSGSLASLGNVGHGIGNLGTMGNYASLPAVVKFIFSADMFLGRIEIFPLLIVASLALNRSER